MPITLSKIYYGPRSIDHFEALEQTCRLHQLSGSGEKYFFSASAIDQGHSTSCTHPTEASLAKKGTRVPAPLEGLEDP